MNKSAIYNYKDSDSRPYIPIWLCYKHQFFKTKIDCLLDSGSDTNLFPAAWGEAVKINIRKGKEKWIYGIGKNNKIKAYTHEVKLMTSERSFITFADFSYEQETPLLGRRGFFDHFKSIAFIEKEKTIKLEW